MSDEPHAEDQLQITLSRAVAEAIQRQAYEEGRTAGHADGYQEGWTACHEEMTTDPAPATAHTCVDWHARLSAFVASLIALAALFPNLVR